MRNAPEIIIIYSIGLVSTLALSIIRRYTHNFIIALFKEIIILFFNITLIGALLTELDSTFHLNSENFTKIFDICCVEALFFHFFLSRKLKSVSIFCFAVLIALKFEINDYNLLFLFISILCIMIDVNKQKAHPSSILNEKKGNLYSALPYDLDLLFEINQEMKMRLKSCKFKTFRKEEKKTFNFISKLQKTRIQIKKEYSHFPDAEAIISDLSSNIVSNENTSNFQDFILYMRKKEDQKYFCSASLFFRDEEESRVVFFWKIKSKIMFQIKQDLFFKEAVRLKTLCQNYNKFTYYIVHKLRNFLNCIVNLELLESSNNFSPEVVSQEFIMPAVLSSKLILNSSNDLLDITQIEADNFKLNNVEFDLCSLLEEIAEIMMLQVRRRKLKLNINFDCSLKIIKNDRNRIRQIIINLLSCLLYL